MRLLTRLPAGSPMLYPRHVRIGSAAPGRAGRWVRSVTGRLIRWFGSAPYGRSRFVVEPLLVLAGVAAYFGVRGLTDDEPQRAARDASMVEGFERALGLDVERSVQGTIVHHPALVDLANWIYIWGHWPVIGVTLVWLLYQHPDVLRRVRSAMFLSGGVALVVFAAFPLMPPRLHLAGMVDTVTLRSHAYRVLQPPAFVNTNAAMPSLHAGWNLLMGLALVEASRRTSRRLTAVALRVIAAVMPLLMTFSVLSTANHYLIDVFAGEALAVAAWAGYARVTAARRRGREPTRPVWPAPAGTEHSQAA